MDTTPTTKQKFQWQLEWRIALFTALLLPFLVGLGLWQLERAGEKSAIAASWESRQQAAVVPLDIRAINVDELAYRRVLLQGEYLADRDFLLDNRIVNGRYGVEVISPFRLANGGGLVLVNRGWIEADRSRQVLPTVVPETGVLSLRGSVYVAPGTAFTLGQISTGESWPRLIQALEVESLGKMLGEPLFPYTVRLEPAPQSVYRRDWPLVNSSPEKHQAYAVQWFSMAVVLALLFIWRSTNLAEILRQARSAKSDTTRT
jgi:surfeit locus 1 family protein